MRRRSVVSKATRRANQQRANRARIQLVAVASRIDKDRAARPVVDVVSAGRAAADKAVEDHVTTVTGSGDAWSASCSCTWATKKPTAERYARGAATKHKNGIMREASGDALDVAA